MGASNSYRYVNTNGVPNSNSGTYTYGSGSTGGTVDLGETNGYRYVNASNVYAKGLADGDVKHNVSCSFQCYLTSDKVAGCYLEVYIDGTQVYAQNGIETGTPHSWAERTWYNFTV